jgi:nucleotide-binding universal stress UspA family protein
MKVLICSDGHPQSEVAARFFSSAGTSRDARVTLLGIIEHPSDEQPLVQSLRRIADILSEKGIAIETVTRRGFPIAEIQKQTREERYDLVVIGAERKNGGPFALSTKAYHIIKEVDLPVLVTIGQRTELRKLLICSGGRHYIEKAVKLAGELVSKGEVQVTILHVLAEAPVIYSDLLDGEDDLDKVLASNSSLARSLRRELGVLGALGVRAQLKLRHGFVGAQIVREVEDGDYDLVVAGSAPTQGILRTYVLGDVTSEIVDSVNCPVLVVRGDPPAAANRWWRIFQCFLGRRVGAKS